jgi:hypothetical protein
VDQLLARFRVLPLNNPPHFPRYNGAMEKGIRDLKAALDQRHERAAPTDFALTVELTAHELNHQPRRYLNGRTACAARRADIPVRRCGRPPGRPFQFGLALRLRMCPTK